MKKMSKFNGTFIGIDTSGCPYDFAACLVAKKDELGITVLEEFQMKMKTKEDSITFENKVCELENKYNAVRI